MMLEGMNNADMGGGRFGDVVTDPGWGFRLMTIITLTTGTGLLMWLGEQATERGIGNGTSMIIFASIVSGIPRRRQLLAGHGRRRSAADDRVLLGVAAG
jgi:preprotein translocase subunit SecY